MLPAIESVINSMRVTPVRSRTDKWRYGGVEAGFQQGVGTPRAGNYGRQTPGAEENTKRVGRACRARAAYHAGLAVNGFARSARVHLGRLRPLTAALRRGARCAGNPARSHASKEFDHEHPRYIACP